MSLERNKMYANLLINNGDDGTYLFLKRSKDSFICPGQWCLPGGHIESFEEPQTAALREAFEETGLNFFGKLVPDYMKMIKTPKATCFYYNVYMSNPIAYGVLKIDPLEHDNYIWMPIIQAVNELDLMMDLGDHLKEIFFRLKPQPKF